MEAAAPRRVIRYALPGAWISGILLLVLLLNLALSLRAANWTDGIGILAPVVLGGYALGLAMSYSRWRGAFPAFHSLIVGTVWVLIWVSRIPQVPDELAGADRIAYIGNKLVQWLVLLFSDSPVRSNEVFVLWMALMMWWIGFLAAWAVFREGRVWRAIIPIGLVMAVNMYYGPDNLKFYFALFVVLALLLAVRSHLANQELTWQYERVRYANDIQFDFMRDGLIFAIVVVMLAMFMPNAAGNGTLSQALEPLRDPWHRVEEEWGRLFSSLNYQGNGLRPAFGDTLTLGGPRDLGETLIMDVRATAGRYWRAVAFDTYTGTRWLNTSGTAQLVDSISHVNAPDYGARRELTQTVTTYFPAGNVLFAAPQPLRVSLKATADLAVIEPGADGEPPLAEVVMLHRRDGRLEVGTTYLVVSALSTATIEDLQEAGTEYPTWVADTYLDLPTTLSSRVKELAEQVTASAETPFDKAVALEQYLRGFEYNDQIPAPPAGVDGVDYFLFDIKAGYCDYYATAFAMMARSLGIPARVSAGYNQGEYVPEIDGYRVREFNGHSWPEVFFPGYGWIEFEPTASEVEIVRVHRPEENAGADEVPPEDSFQEEEDRFGEDPELGSDTPPPPADLTGTPPTFSGPGWVIGLGAMLLLVVVAAILLVRPSPQRKRQALVDPQLAIRLYGRLIQWAARLGLRVMPSQTPNEHAAVLYGAVPEGRSAIVTITDLYVYEQYSPNPAGEDQAEQAVDAWSDLRPIFRRQWVRKLLGIRRKPT